MNLSLKKNSHLLPTLLTLLLSLSLFMGLAGCQKNSSTSQNRIDMDHLPLDRRIGMIESLGGVKTSSQGTHLLKIDENNTILLRSLSINLDETKYQDAQVEVRGTLNYTKDSKQIMDVQNIDILDVTPITQATSINWKEYVNATLGFSLRYRDDFQIKEDPTHVFLAKKVTTTKPATETPPTKPLESATSTPSDLTPEHTITISVLSHKPEETLTTFLNLKSDSAKDLLSAGYTKSKIGADSLDALKEINTENRRTTFTLDHNQAFYTITFQGGDDDQNLEDQNLFFEFLSSFKFLDQGKTSTDSSKTLTSTEKTN